MAETAKVIEEEEDSCTKYITARNYGNEWNVHLKHRVGFRFCVPYTLSYSKEPSPTGPAPYFQKHILFLLTMQISSQF